MISALTPVSIPSFADINIHDDSPDSNASFEKINFNRSTSNPNQSLRKSLFTSRSGLFHVTHSLPSSPHSLTFSGTPPSLGVERPHFSPSNTQNDHAALLELAKRGEEELLADLLRFNHDPNLVNEREDKEGDSALHVAACEPFVLLFRSSIF